MSVLLKCAACGHEVPFADGSLETEAICPGCEVLLRRRSEGDQMAIPVSMEIPESFGHADLEHVPKQSDVLVHRYQRQLPPSRGGGKVDPHAESNFALAKAIEKLASAIEGKTGLIDGVAAAVAETASPPASGHYEEKATRPSEASTAGEKVPVLNGGSSAMPAPSGTHANGRKEEGVRSSPLPARVLVRREAAAEAHRFRRDIQAATDVKGEHRSALSVWVESHPMTMLISGLVLLIALVVMTAIVMEGAISPQTAEEEGSSSVMGSQWSSEPDFASAEQQARGFLNAVALKSALPYIFQSTEIREKLDRFFEPIANPGDYELSLRQRQSAGERAVYYYQVKSGSETLPLAVLQEGQNFRVFWEFGAAVGDLSWDAFLKEKPIEPTLMRAFLRPHNHYDASHNPEEWSSWLVEGHGPNQQVVGFVKRGGPEELRLNAALEENAITRKRASWVMGQVMMACPETSLTSDSVVAEISEVPLASWLPEEFVSGNTFYSDKYKVKEKPSL
ncbi:MAG: hypothetical protein Q7Q71_10915 [Verrucomicrobiota bacterium JB023]|nr:hypothetical protein [Verrucomicrobiota bacterium JB023]